MLDEPLAAQVSKSILIEIARSGDVPAQEPSPTPGQRLMSQTRAARLVTAIAAGPNVFLRSLIVTPTPASATCRMIIPTATASSQRLHPVANGTTLMIANAMLLAQA